MARSEYLHPCVPYEDINPGKIGFFSGFQPVDANLNKPPKFSVRINDTNPVFYYCTAPGSCIGQGMVGVINPAANTSLVVQRQFARNSSYMLQPGEPVPAEGGGSTENPNEYSSTASGTATATTGTVAAATSSAAPAAATHHSSLGGGAIAGIAIGAAAVALLAAALIYMCGRNSRRRSATPPPGQPPMGEGGPYDPSRGSYAPSGFTAIGSNQAKHMSHSTMGSAYPPPHDPRYSQVGGYSPALPGYVPPHPQPHEMALPHQQPYYDHPGSAALSPAPTSAVSDGTRSPTPGTQNAQMGSMNGGYQGVPPYSPGPHGAAIMHQQENPHETHAELASTSPPDGASRGGLMGLFRKNSTQKTGVERYG